MIEKFDRKKKIIIATICFLIVAIIGYILGTVIYFLTNSSTFLVLFSISFPFMILTYITFILGFLKFNVDRKGKLTFILFYFARFACIIISLLLCILYLYLMGTLKTSEAYYIIVSPVLYTIGYLVGIVIK